MIAKVVLLAALLSGCSHDRVLVALAGDVAGATEIEIIVAEPYASKRLQRAEKDLAMATVEDTFYVAQRASVRFAVDPAQKLAGTRLQLELPDREPFLPIAIARDANGVIVGMGTYLPDQIYIDGITPAAKLLADVTLYDVVIEPVTERAPDATGVLAGHVALVSCDNVASGIVWRRGEPSTPKPQLRIVLPLEDPDGSAIARLDNAVDLDCDGHSPGVGGLAARDDGDRLDCDDIDIGTGPEALELCNGRDDDCDGALDGLHATSGTCPNVPAGCPSFQLCDERTGGEICASQNIGCNGGLICPIPFIEASETTVKACNSTTGFFAGDSTEFNPCLQQSCEITLVAVDDRWDVRIGDPENPANGLFEPFHTTPGVRVGIRATSSEEFSNNGTGTGRFTGFVRTPVGSYMTTFVLDLSRNKSVTACQDDLPFECGAAASPQP